MIDSDKIEAQAKKILDSFAEALEKVKTSTYQVAREQDRREEGEKNNSIDRKIMFKNAPKVQGDCIEAERGSWV